MSGLKDNEMKPTQEQIIAWAREARFYEGEIADDIQWFTVLATLAYEAGRKDENEARAKWLEEYAFRFSDIRSAALEMAAENFRLRREQ